ncbi:MAG: carboxypeptidase-like regulatory domain-containing protein, partial [Bryobacteraceae bacterium]
MELSQRLSHSKCHLFGPVILLSGLLLIAGLLTVTPPGVHAQVLYGSIVGVVEDQTGAVVPNAAVSITIGATGQTRETVANETGRYSFANVLPGSYSLKVVASGFRPYTETNVIATINTVTRIDIKLLVGTA